MATTPDYTSNAVRHASSGGGRRQTFGDTRLGDDVGSSQRRNPDGVPSADGRRFLSDQFAPTIPGPSRADRVRGEPARDED